MRNKTKFVTVTFTIKEDLAKPLAQFLSRANFSNYLRLAENERQAFDMMYGAAVINSALEDAGIEGF